MIEKNGSTQTLIKRKKRKVNEECGKSGSDNIKEKKFLFWRRRIVFKDVNEELEVDKEELRNSW